MQDLAQQSVSLEQKVLRIVEGRLAGKEYPLSPGGRVCIGHSLANDVVLRGAGTRNTTIELRLTSDTAALRVIEGQAELLGRTLASGEDAVLPPYLPFRLGEFVLAHGQREADRWQEAATLAVSPCAAPVAPLPAPRLSDRLVAFGREQFERVGNRLSPVHLGLAVATVALLGAATGPVSSLIGEYTTGAASLESRLQNNGFGHLTVTDNPVGGLIVSGMVLSEGDVLRLRSLTAEQGTPVLVDVTSAASIANAATDILQAQGIDARVSPAGLGGITVTAPFLPADRQRELTALLQADLPAVKRIAFEVDDTLGDDPLQAFFAGSGTGLASAIDNPGHIVTADGARWFPGAVLPTGHRLIFVGEGLVRFEKDGRIEEIRL